MVIYILYPNVAMHRTTDANNKKIWKCDLTGIKMLTVLYEPLLNDLHVRISTHIPNGRKVRVIRGALDNADPNNNPPAPTDTSNITSDNNLDAFLQLTEAKLIKLLVILHQVAGRNSPTPPLPPEAAQTIIFPWGGLMARSTIWMTWRIRRRR